MKNKIYKLYDKLSERYGDTGVLWPQWCAKNKDEKTRELVAIGAILTQRTSWNNADIALRNLKRKRLLSLEKISNLKDLSELTELTRSAGFYQTKPKRLFSFAKFVIDNYGGITSLKKEKTSIAREKLLGVYGIGPETADTILLYALDKPSFVIDEYTKRFVKKHKLGKVYSYKSLKGLFEKSLPKSVKIYQKYHVLIIVDNVGEEKSVMRTV